MGFLQNVRARVFGGDVSNLSVQEAGIGDELAAAGRALGRFMESTSLAMAKTQGKLNKNSAIMAEELCKTEVELIRARETIYDDAGKIQDIRIVTGNGRLIEVVDAAFYQFDALSVQAQFSATELATSSQSKVKQASIGASVGVSKGGGLLSRPRASGSVSGSASFSDVTVGTTFDSSVGVMRMNTLVVPNESASIPKPLLILQGPNIVIGAGAVSTNATTGARTLVVTITVTKKDGTTPNDGRILAIDTDGIDWEIVPSTNPPANPIQDAPQTDAGGILAIRLTRQQTPNAPPLESRQAAIGVRLGLATATATVTT